MPEYLAPGVFVQEIDSHPKPIEGVSTSVTGFVGRSVRGTSGAHLVTSWAEYRRKFGGFLDPRVSYLPFAVRGFFENGGQRCVVARVASRDAIRAGLEVLAEADEVSIVCAPDHARPALAPAERAALTRAIVRHCEKYRRFAILSVERDRKDFAGLRAPRGSSFAAIYAPWIRVRDPRRRRLVLIPSIGHVAGIYARTDLERGVHKAPVDEEVRGLSGAGGPGPLEIEFTDADQGLLNPRSINLIRNFGPVRGIRVWGARTMSGDPEWKYVNVRRLFLYLERSIDEGTRWVVFEPNGESLWSRVRNLVENFLIGVWRSGALTGAKPEEAFFVRCDRTTMTQNDLDQGRLVCTIGFAPIRPAEFVVFRIGQWTLKPDP